MRQESWSATGYRPLGIAPRWRYTMCRKSAVRRMVWYRNMERHQIHAYRNFHPEAAIAGGAHRQRLGCRSMWGILRDDLCQRSRCPWDFESTWGLDNYRGDLE